MQKPKASVGPGLPRGRWWPSAIAALIVLVLAGTNAGAQVSACLDVDHDGAADDLVTCPATEGPHVEPENLRTCGSSSFPDSTVFRDSGCATIWDFDSFGGCLEILGMPVLTGDPEPVPATSTAECHENAAKACLGCGCAEVAVNSAQCAN